MALLEASLDNRKSWIELPTPAPQNYYTTREHLENSYTSATGYLVRDIVRRSRRKVFCGYDALPGDKLALLDSLYDYDYFYLRYTDNQNRRQEIKCYSGPLDSKVAKLNKVELKIKWATSIQVNFIEY